MRIVSLCPSITESVFALGRGDWLVGRTKFCVQPRGVVGRVERVGGTKNPKLDRILALAPDLVLMNEEENRKEDADALTAAGVRVLSSFARDVESATAALRQLGEAVDAGSAAKAIADDIEARAAVLRTQAATAAPVSFAYLIWRDPLMAAGRGTYIDSILSLAGGHNVTGGDSRYPELDVATLARADRVLLSSEPFPFAAKHRAELSEAAGLPEERFVLADGQLLSWHGVRTHAGLDYAFRLLHED